ncbi:MAG: beta strand repeat-containing protein [Bacteroidia bacterium]
MKKILLFVAFYAVILNVNAQLSGTRTVGSSNPLYPTIAIAIDSLNLHGVAVGGVTFEVTAGHTETTFNRTITTTTSGPTRPVSFVKTGTGLNPRITAGTGVSTTVDYVIGILGSDNITFDGIDILDPTTNTTNTTRMEWGYAILKQSATNGCYNITITNCNIVLQKANTASNGIRVGNHNNLNTTAITISNISGIHKNINLTNNNISNVYNGIFHTGATTAIYFDEDLNFSSNVVTNFGGSSTVSYGIYALNYKNILVENDSINGGSGTTTSFYGIWTATAANANIVINNNFVRLQNTGTTNVWYPIYNTGGSGNGMVIISNNRVDSCNSTTATTATFYAIYNQSSALNVNIFNNTISRTVASSSSGTTALLYNQAGTNSNIYNNIIIDNIINSTSTRVLYCIWANGTTINTYGNRIVNNVRNGGSSGTVAGLYVSGGTLQNMYNNTVSDLSSNISSVTINGIMIAAGTRYFIYNNLVANIFSPINANNNGINGINITTTSTAVVASIYHNTVFLNATSTGANFGSNAVFVQTGPSVELSNNLLYNTSSSAGTGRTVAYRRANTTYATYAFNSNNNLFYAGTPGVNNLLYTDGTNNIQTLGALMAYNASNLPARDVESVTENVSFISTVASNSNFLRVNTSNPTQVESGGRFGTGINGDFLNSTIRTTFPLTGQTNGGGNAPDIGAFEQDMIPLDIAGPSILYRNLRNGSASVNQRHLINVIIRDKSRVDTLLSNRPRIYYRKSSNINSLASTNDNFTDGWKFSVANNTTSPFNFTIDYSKLFGGNPLVNDTIFYFVVAQDMQLVPLVGVNSASFALAPTSVNLSFGNFPVTGSNFYVIDTALLMNYTVGSFGADFTSFTRPDGFFNFINNNVIDTNVTVTVLTDIINETGQVALNELSVDGNNPANTFLIIRPGGIGSKFVGGTLTTGGLFRFNNANNVIIDGNDLFGNPYNLAFANMATSGANCTFMFSGTSGQPGCSNITISNSRIYTGNRINTSNCAVFIGGTTVTLTNTSGGFGNNTIRL